MRFWCLTSRQFAPFFSLICCTTVTSTPTLKFEAQKIQVWSHDHTKKWFQSVERLCLTCLTYSEWCYPSTMSSLNLSGFISPLRLLRLWSFHNMVIRTNFVCWVQKWVKIQPFYTLNLFVSWFLIFFFKWGKIISPFQCCFSREPVRFQRDIEDHHPWILLTYTAWLDQAEPIGTEQISSGSLLWAIVWDTRWSLQFGL